MTPRGIIILDKSPELNDRIQQFIMLPWERHCDTGSLQVNEYHRSVYRCRTEPLFTSGSCCTAGRVRQGLWRCLALLGLLTGDPQAYDKDAKK